MQTLKEAIYLLIGIVLIVGSVYLVLQRPAPRKYQVYSAIRTVQIGEKGIPVEVADSEEERTLGLSGREGLETGTGLLFIFETPGHYGFWMKDMKFPIDIVWISESGKVVGIEKNINPDSYPALFYPSESVKYVLELNSNDAENLGIDTLSQVYLGPQK